MRNTEKFFQLDQIQLLLGRIIAERHAERAPANAVDLIRLFGENEALRIAKENELVSHVGHALADAGRRQEMSDEWFDSHEDTRRRIAAYLDQLDRVAASLATHGIPLIALKNAGIARGLYPCPGCCPMGDVDVLVQRRHFRSAHRLLVDDDFQFEFRSPLEKRNMDEAEACGGAEYCKQLSDGSKMWLELQWRPVAGRWIRPDQEPDAEQLIARSQPIAGSDVRILCGEDNLLQVALHTAKHSYVRAPGFRLHTDVDRIVHRQSIDWDRFLTLATELHVATAVFFSLWLAHALLDTPIPNDVLDRLCPPKWKIRRVLKQIGTAGLFGPNDRKFSRGGYILLNTLLYDDCRGLLRGVFPETAWMRDRYGFQNRVFLPYYHGRRICELLFRRLQT